MRDLSDLLIGGGSDVVIAYRQSRPILLSQFRRDIAHNATRLRERNCRRGLLMTVDTYWCAVGMLALFQIGARQAIGFWHWRWLLRVDRRSEQQQAAD